MVYLTTGLFVLTILTPLALSQPDCKINTVTVWANAFIPRDLPNGVTKPIPGGPYFGRTMINGPFEGISDCFITDDRSFNPGLGSSARDHPSSRMVAIAYIDINSGALLNQKNFSSGTIELDCEDGDVEDNCLAIARGPVFNNVVVLPVSSSPPTTISVDLDLSAYDPCFRLTPTLLMPDIDIKGKFILRIRNPNSVDVLFDGKVEVFPAFEFYAQADGGSAVPVLQLNPLPGLNPFDLVPNNLGIRVFKSIRLCKSSDCCLGRKIAIVIDSSGSNKDTDPGNLRIAAAQAFNSMLVTDTTAGPPDRVTVVDFDSSARVIYPLGDPSQASFDGIDSVGGTFIAGGIAAAIAELTKDPNDPTADLTGIVVLTDGQDSDRGALRDQVSLAGSLGIRVSFGFLSPPDIPIAKARAKRASTPRATSDAPPELLTAILKTGGIFGTISSAEALRPFVDLVIERGATNIDGSGGANHGGVLFPGITIAALGSASQGPNTFTYHASAGQKLEFVVRSTTGQLLNSTLRDVRLAVELDCSSTDSQGTAKILYTAANDVDLELVVASTDQQEGVYSVTLTILNPPSCTSSVSLGPTSCVTPAPLVSCTSTFSPVTQCTTIPLPVSCISAPPISCDSCSISYSPSPPSFSIPTTSTPYSQISDSMSYPLSFSSSTDIPITSTSPPSYSQSSSFQPKFGSEDATETATLSNSNAIFDPSSQSFKVLIALVCIIVIQSTLIFGSLIWCFCRRKRPARSGAFPTSTEDKGLTPVYYPSWLRWHRYTKIREERENTESRFPGSYSDRAIAAMDSEEGGMSKNSRLE